MDIKPETINKASEYAYNEQVFVHTGFYKGKYARIEHYDDKKNIYILKVKLTEHSSILVETKPEYIRHIKAFLKYFGRH